MAHLEISQLFGFEDILLSQKIYAIVYDRSFIAGIEHWQFYISEMLHTQHIVVGNATNFFSMIDFVTESQFGLFCEFDQISNILLGSIIEDLILQS